MLFRNYSSLSSILYYSLSKPGLLSSSLDELKHLLRELANVDGMETGAINSQLELEMRLHSAEESLNKMERYLADKTEENKRLKEHTNQLTSKIRIIFIIH